MVLPTAWCTLSLYPASSVFLSHKTPGMQAPLPLPIPQLVFIALGPILPLHILCPLRHPDMLISTIKFHACSKFYASKYMYQYIVHDLLDVQ